MNPSNLLRVLLAGLAATALIGALVLTGLGIATTEAWATVGTLVGLFAGQHIPPPK